MKRVFDEFDVALLNLLQNDNQATAERLARSVPLSPSAVTRRLRRLREAGLIAKEVAILPEVTLGRRLRAAVHVQLREHADPVAISAFRASIEEEPDIQSCLELSGIFDLLLLTVSLDMPGFTAFADRVLMSSAAVQRYECSFVKKVWKSGTAIAVRLSDVSRHRD